MDIQRIRSEIARATDSFWAVELYPTNDGGVFIKAGFQTSACHGYIATVTFANYPNQMPRVYITKPALQSGCPHRYQEGNICYLHPNMWNPGRHDLTFVLARTAKWLNKAEVWRYNGAWPGAEVAH